MPALVIEIFKLTVDYFKTKLLVWVHSHGGWVGVNPSASHTQNTNSLNQWGSNGPSQNIDVKYHPKHVLSRLSLCKC